MIKRAWAVILAVCLLAASVCGLAEPAEEAPERAQLTEDFENRTVEVVRNPEHLTVANTTRMTGRFFSGMWGSGTSDIDVRSLVHGCDLVRWNGENGAFETDPTVVSGIVVTENEQKDRSYMLVLCDDMVYSDGTPVTAWDYAFTFLLQMSGEIDDLGGVAVDRDYLAGARDYAAGSAPLIGTDFVRLAADGAVVTDGTVPEGSRLVEQVRYVRDMTMPVDENGEYAVIGFDAIGAKEPMTLYRDGLGELLYTGGFEQPENADPVNVDASGYIADWHYENGVRTFEDGTHPMLPGVKVVADDTLTITVDHEYLPFFYELGLLSCEPCPISRIAPGVKVMDDGEGVYLANAPREDEQAESADPDAPVYTTELLEKTLLDPETGYLFHPGVSTGPYTLVSFDGTTAEFELNPLYKGDADDHRPTVPRLTYTLADNATMVEKLATGEYDIINKVTMADTLNAAMTLMRSGEFTREDAGEAQSGEQAVAVDVPWHTDEGFTMSNYPRTGLSFISFCCARPTVNSLAVRQAIAWSMDRDQIVQDYTAGFGVRMDCYSGLGQWMVGLVDGTTAPPVKEPEDPSDEAAQTAYEEELKKWEELSLDNLMDYELDLDKARALLDNDGWRTEKGGQKLNERGLREKDGVVLDLVLIYPRGNAIAQTLERNMVQNLREIGVGLTLVPVDMPELLARYYRQMSGPVEVTVDGVVEQREVDMIYLASNFDIIFDPSVHFSTEDNGHNWAYTGCADEQLYELALDMRHTEPADVYGYVKKWIAFEERFNEVLPMIPLYSNVYFDFYTDKLTEYNIDESITWGQALVGARMAGLSEEPEVTPAPEEAETEPAGDEIEIVDAGDETEIQDDGTAADQGDDIEIIDDFASSFGG